MAAIPTETVQLQDNFYRDSFSKVMLLLFGALIIFCGFVGMAVYLYLEKPAPVNFPVADEMRVLPPVPLSEPYLSRPDLLQWVADVLPASFVLDFNRYNDQLKEYAQNFTPTGWQTFLNQLNIYANYNNVQTYKLFVTATPVSAPYVIREGVIPETGRYGWWVQMALTVNYAGLKAPADKPLVLQVLVVRISTLNNLTGVGIDNVIQAPGTAGV